MGRGTRDILLDYRVKNDLKKFNNKKLLVAFSGGRDSVALLHFLHINAQEYNYKIVACHINHGIRGDLALRDETFCRKFCQSYLIDLIVESLDVPGYVKRYGCSIEDGARRLRYEALFKIRQLLQCDLIVTAHHQDDYIENFFVKAFLGSSIENLKGFGSNNYLVRPFRNIGRKAIEHYIEEHNLGYVDDETNFSVDFVRNWVRLKIVPEIRSYNEHYLKNILALQEQSEELKDYMEKKLSNIEIVREVSYAEVKKRDIVFLHPFEQKYIINKMVEGFFRVERKHIENILKLINGNSRRISLPDNFLCEVSFNKIRLFKRDMIKDYEIVKNSGDDIVILPKLCKYIKFGGFYRDKFLTVRNRRNGDRIGSDKVKDLMIDRKIDLFERDRAIIVEYDSRIIWAEYIYEKEGIEVFRLEV